MQGLSSNRWQSEAAEHVWPLPAAQVTWLQGTAHASGHTLDSSARTRFRPVTAWATAEHARFSLPTGKGAWFSVCAGSKAITMARFGPRFSQLSRCSACWHRTEQAASEALVGPSASGSRAAWPRHLELSHHADLNGRYLRHRVWPPQPFSFPFF